MKKIVRFDIISLYSEILISMALEAVRNELITDHELSLRTNIPIDEIMDGVKLCLSSTISKFHDKTYKKQKEWLWNHQFPPS